MPEEFSRSSQKILCVQAGTGLVNGLRPLLPEFHISTAETGAHGLREAGDRVFDLYILDTRLLDLPGEALDRAIRQFDPHTPILLCVHAEGESAHPQLGRAGTQGCISNPIDAVAAPRIVRDSIALAHQHSLEAQSATQAAVWQAIADRLGRMAAGADHTRATDLMSHEAGLKTRAYEAFEAAGGARADFARLWPSIFDAACRQAT